jgi:hypothetical protein
MVKSTVTLFSELEFGSARKMVLKWFMATSTITLFSELEFGSARKMINGLWQLPP